MLGGEADGNTTLQMKSKKQEMSQARRQAEVGEAPEEGRAAEAEAVVGGKTWRRGEADEDGNAAPIWRRRLSLRGVKGRGRPGKQLGTKSE